MRLNSCVWLVAGAMLSGCFVDRARYVAGNSEAGADATAMTDAGAADSGIASDAADEQDVQDVQDVQDAMVPVRRPRLVAPLSSTNVATSAIALKVEHDGAFYVEFNRTRDFTGASGSSVNGRGTGVVNVMHTIMTSGGAATGIWFFRACAVVGNPASCSAPWSINVLGGGMAVSNGGMGAVSDVLGSRSGDLIVSARTPVGSHMSRAYIYSTFANGASTHASAGVFDECTDLHRLLIDRCPGSPDGLLLGRSGAILGDATGDGRAEVALFGEQGEASGVGTVAILNGDDRGRLQFVGRFSGNNTVPLVGELGAAGDFNGDGLADLAAAVQDDTGKRRVDVFLSTGAALPFEASRRVVLPFPINGTLPAPVRPIGVGDVNGDGYADIAVRAKNGSDGSDELWIYLGNANPMSNAPVVRRVPSAGRSNWALSIAGAGDADGDGRADVFVMHGATPSASNIALVSARPDGDLMVSDMLSPARTPGGTALSVLLGAGDVTGDGLVDAVLGDLEAPMRTVAVLHRTATGGSGTFVVAAPTITVGSSERIVPRVVVRDVDDDGVCEIITTTRGMTGEEGVVRVHEIVVGASMPRLVSTVSNPDMANVTFGIDVF